MDALHIDKFYCIFLLILLQVDTAMAEQSMASDDEKFEKLKAYNYKHNRVFQDGWRKVKACVTQEMLFDSFVNAQIFFYSRYSYYSSGLFF